MKKNINEIYDRFFMMDVILDDDGQSVSSLYFLIDDVVIGNYRKYRPKKFLH